jgi:hypothetical protein
MTEIRGIRAGVGPAGAVLGCADATYRAVSKATVAEAQVLFGIIEDPRARVSASELEAQGQLDLPRRRRCRRDPAGSRVPNATALEHGAL